MGIEAGVHQALTIPVEEGRREEDKGGGGGGGDPGELRIPTRRDTAYSMTASGPAQSACTGGAAQWPPSMKSRPRRSAVHVRNNSSVC